MFLSGTVFDWRQAVKLAQTLSEGLAYLHTDLQKDGEHIQTKILHIYLL